MRRIHSRHLQEDILKKLLLILGMSVAPLANLAVMPAAPAMAAVKLSKLGDLSAMRKIVADTLALVEGGKTKEAVKRITDYETAWDKNQSALKKRDPKTWKKLDEASDVALSTVRYPSATPEEMKKDLSDLIAVLDNPSL